MNIEDRKLLTEFIDEVFSPGLVGRPYKFQGIITSNRSFTTSDDFFAVKGKLVEKGLWEKFLSFSFSILDEDHPIGVLSERGDPELYYNADFIDWLIDEARFCQLAVDFLKGENNEQKS